MSSASGKRRPRPTNIILLIYYGSWISPAENLGQYAAYIAVPSFMLCLILLLFCLIMVMFHLKRKRINRRIQAKNVLSYEKELGTFPHQTAAQKNTCSQMLPLDAWEFPREKLHILGNRLLGKRLVQSTLLLSCSAHHSMCISQYETCMGFRECTHDEIFFMHKGKGAFGKVFKAHAEGIIPDTPERNVVAVKMVKGRSEASTVAHI